MPKNVRYRFEAYLYPAHVSRIEIETGEADWVYIRRQSHKLAAERNDQVMLYVYNEDLRRWDYIGRAVPGGDWYDFRDGGPFILSDDGRNYKRKEGGMS